MSSTKGQAVIEQKTPVGQVQRGQRNRGAFVERFANREIGSCVPGKMGRHAAHAIGESGTVVDVAASRDLARQTEIESSVQRVALIVVQRKNTAGAGGPEIGQAAG